jgi:spermidine synthase
LALARWPEHIGRFYRADLLGAGSGAVGMIVLLSYVPPTVCLTVLSALGLLAAALASLERRLAQPLWLTLVLIGGSVVLPGVWPPAWVALRMSEYKGLPQALRAPDAVVLSERSSPLGWLTVLHSPTIPLRYAPDLSLNSSVEPPPQLGLFTDGDNMSVITQYDGQRAGLAFLDLLPSALPYHLLHRPHVLIVGAGAGMDVLQARYHQARRIEAVERNPQVVDLVQRQHAAFTGSLYSAPDVRVHVADARGFISTSRDHYDLIQVALLDSFGAATTGVYALHESYLYTVEALQTYVRHLQPGGFLAITRWLTLPPRDSLKLFATALMALERSGMPQPEQRLALIRGWQTVTLLVKQGVISAADIAAIRAFCEARAFDLAYYPGMPGGLANRYNVLEEPYVFAGAMALVGEHRDDFLRRYKYNITPATDDKPYFWHFFTWRLLPDILARRGSGSVPPLEWGFMMLLATLLQAVVVSVTLIVLPLRRLRHPAVSRRERRRIGAYFAALGLAFLCIEIAFMQRFILFLGHPLLAMAVVLGAFLVFAGLGSGYAAGGPRSVQVAAQQDTGRHITRAVTGIVLIALLYLGLLGPLLQRYPGLPEVVKVVLTLALIAPLAFVMGMPLPLGLVRVGRQAPTLLPWAWGISGCTSVVSAVLATVLAIHYGFTAVVLVALGLYVFAAALFSSPPLPLGEGRGEGPC